MEIVLIILAVICGIVGIIGSVVPGLPGPPISWLGLLLMRFAQGVEISTTLLWVTFIIMIIVTVLDYIIPSWLTKIGGGSKAATRGSIIGLIIGLFFFPPIGMIVGPFLGAFVGEVIDCSSSGKAFRVALLSFLGFLLTTGLKLIYSLILIYYIIRFLF